MAEELQDDWFERAMAAADDEPVEGDDESAGGEGESEAADGEPIEAHEGTEIETDPAETDDGTDDTIEHGAATESALGRNGNEADTAIDRFDTAGEANGSDEPDDRSAPVDTVAGGDSAETTARSTAGSEPAAPEATASADESDGLFEEDFGSALQSAGAPSMGGSGGGPDRFSDVDFGLDEGTPDFDEDLETSLARIQLGIEGLDQMIQGGIPERSLMVAIGSAGTGKTTCGLQFLNHGLENGERGVYITLEESRSRVINSATEKGWRFDEFDDRGDLAIVDVDPVEMATQLDAIQDELPALIEDFGASRLVLDSVSLLEMMYEDRAARRNEIYDFTKSLKRAGVTALLTSEAAENTPYASRYGIVEYLTDAVFVLQYVRPDDFRETRLAVEIQKIRDANHSREKKPYEITNEGISVHQQANLF
ncbi:KaiC domain-containing protein [Halovivax limisalsi]|uniref:KaiC domain-containing protein n=1 Tax=Halovivax limisalsi TaxID=1453760 RepID=UPI001FFD7A78|nr:KaiC domain-containing protein [Halovivax limisalsi]